MAADHRQGVCLDTRLAAGVGYLACCASKVGVLILCSLLACLLLALPTLRAAAPPTAGHLVDSLSSLRSSMRWFSFPPPPLYKRRQALRAVLVWFFASVTGRQNVQPGSPAALHTASPLHVMSQRTKRNRFSHWLRNSNLDFLLCTAFALLCPSCTLSCLASAAPHAHGCSVPFPAPFLGESRP